MNEDEYYYCVTHKKSILPEDKKEHDFPDCNFIIQECHISSPRKIKLQWAAKSVGEEYGMKIFRLKEKKQKAVIYDLPSDAVLLDVTTEGKDLSQTS